MEISSALTVEVDEASYVGALETFSWVLVTVVVVVGDTPLLMLSSDATSITYCEHAHNPASRRMK